MGTPKEKGARTGAPGTEAGLPVEAPSTGGALREFILAPSGAEILEALLPAYVRKAVYRSLAEAEAGFQSAQRTAMKNAIP